MSFDFKKEYKSLYMPNTNPSIITVPTINYVAVRGTGNPNEQGGEYSQAVGLLYALSYTIKMSYKKGLAFDGFYEYTVPPLEGFWWQDGVNGIDYSRKNEFNWISIIRLPDFITRSDFMRAVDFAADKKKKDFSKLEFLTVNEGLCVQCMHIGSYDTEPQTLAKINDFLSTNGYVDDLNLNRLHHEIYISDPNKCAADKLKTVIRHPIKSVE